MENKKVGRPANFSDGGRMFPVRLSKKMYSKLRKYAFLHEKPMAIIVRECIEERINNNEKMLNNSDIVI